MATTPVLSPRKRSMKSAVSLAIALACVFAAGVSHAVEFQSVGANPAVMYDAPSERGRRVFVAPRGMPVEVVLGYGEWIKVRDASGDLSWIEAKALSPKRNVIVDVANFKMRVAPDVAATVVASADKGVLLEYAGAAVPGWIKVRHRDGTAGFARVSDVWGE